MVRTNPDGRTDARTHIHRTKIVTTMCRLPASGLDKSVSTSTWDAVFNMYKGNVSMDIFTIFSMEFQVINEWKKLLAISNNKKKLNRNIMGSCYSGGHIARDHIHTDIKTCSTDQPQQRHLNGTIRNQLLGMAGRGLQHVFWIGKPPANKRDFHSKRH